MTENDRKCNNMGEALSFYKKSTNPGEELMRILCHIAVLSNIIKGEISLNTYKFILTRN